MSLAGELFWVGTLLIMVAAVAGGTALVLWMLRRAYTSPANISGPRSQRHLCGKCGDPHASPARYGEWLCIRCHKIRWYD